MSNKATIDWFRIGKFCCTAAISGAAGWFGQPLLHDNSDAIQIIVNVFSILAGFLIAIMTLLGEPSLFRGRTWRSDAVKQSNIYNRLTRHKWLFILYLLILGLVFTVSLITKTYPDMPLVVWIERLYLGFATMAFLMSLELPQKLMKLQLDRYDELIEAGRNGGS